jgi:hypothetical protein
MFERYYRSCRRAMYESNVLIIHHLDGYTAFSSRAEVATAHHPRCAQTRVCVDASISSMKHASDVGPEGFHMMMMIFI